MGPVGTDRGAADAVSVIVPSRRLPVGVAMAGFSARTGITELDVVPYPAVTLFFDLGDAPLHVAGATTSITGSVAIGLAPRSLRGHGRDVESLQIRLSPPVAWAAGLPADFGDAAALTDVWGASAATLEDRLRKASSWQERFALAAAEIDQRVHALREVDPEVREAWWRLTTSYGSARVESLATQVGWSRTRLWSRFRTQTGLTPKRAARLIRFDRAAHRLAAGDSPATVAAQNGYADQSHLSREVAEFTGSTPTAIARAPWLDVDDVAWRSPGYAAARPDAGT